MASRSSQPRSEEVTKDGYQELEKINAINNPILKEIRLREFKRSQNKKFKPLYKGLILKTYGSARKSSWPRSVGWVTGIVFSIGLLSITRNHPGSEKMVEVVSDFVIAAGTGFTAWGVVLNRSASRWLSEIVAQEENISNRSKYVRESAHTRDLISLIESINLDNHKNSTICDDAENTEASQNTSHAKKVVPLKTLLEEFKERLKNEASGRAHVYVISQKDLARLFLDASKSAFFGSILIVLGTLLLAVLALKK